MRNSLKFINDILGEYDTGEEGANVLTCQAKECSYNHGGKCQTIGVSIGGSDPGCTTFVAAGFKGGIRNVCAKVGACKVRDCVHNDSLECVMNGIRVVYHNEQALCDSYNNWE